MDPLSRDLLRWYDESARVLPWRSHPSPYRTWLSEVMLQQTQVDTVLPYFQRFLERFPTVEDLASAPIDEVLTMWSGLGYYSRARNLHKTAQIVCEMGGFPLNIKGLRALPGVGEYMAGAIASIAFGQDEATVDGNIARVMSRIHADPGPRKAMWAHAWSHLPAGRAGDYNQALMDLGARICKPRGAKCRECPVELYCEARKQGKVDELPPRKAKKAAPVRQMLGLVYGRGEDVLLARRPSRGLWGGLWEFPSVVSHGPKWTEGEPRRRWIEAFGVELCEGVMVFEARHVLSHRIFDYQLKLAEGPPPTVPGAYTELRWASMQDFPSLGLSALTSRGLEAIPR